MGGAAVDEPEASSEPMERVFRPAGSPGRRAAIATIGGLVMLAVAALGFAAMLRYDPGVLLQTLLTTAPLLLGTGALASAVTTARTPREVRVSPTGLQITTARDTQTYEWARVGWSNRAVASHSNRRILKIYDVKGRLLATLSDTIAEYDAMAEAIAERIAAKGDPTTERVQLTQARRVAVFLGLSAILMLALFASLAWITHRDLRAERLLKSAAVPGEARIEKRYRARSGFTSSLVYRITTPDGKSASRLAEVRRPVWDTLQGAETVAVIYVPGEPEISRLADGEPPDRDLTNHPLFGYGASAIGVLFSILSLTVSVIAWCGWDIVHDRKTGKISFKRFGTAA